MKKTPSAASLGLLRQKSATRKFLVGSSSKRRLLHKEKTEKDANIFCDSSMVGLDSILARFKEVQESSKISKLDMEDLLVAGHSSPDNFQKIATTAQKLIFASDDGAGKRDWDGGIAFIDSICVSGGDLDTLQRWQSAKTSMMRDYESEYTYGVHMPSRISHLKATIAWKATINLDRGTTVEDLVKILKSTKSDSSKDMIAFRMINTSTGASIETADELIASIDWSDNSSSSEKENNNNQSDGDGSGHQTASSMVIEIVCGWQKPTAESKANKLLLTCSIFALNKRAKGGESSQRRMGQLSSSSNNGGRGIRRTLSHGGGLDRRRGFSPSIRNLRMERSSHGPNHARREMASKATTSFSSSESFRALVDLANQTKSSGPPSRPGLQRSSMGSGSFRSTNRRRGVYRANSFDETQLLVVANAKKKRQMSPVPVLKRSTTVDKDNKYAPTTSPIRPKRRPGVERSSSTNSSQLKRSLSVDNNDNKHAGTSTVIPQKQRRPGVERSSSYSAAAVMIGRPKVVVERSSSCSAAAIRAKQQMPIREDKSPPRRCISLDEPTKPKKVDDHNNNNVNKTKEHKVVRACSQRSLRRKSKEAKEAQEEVVARLHLSSRSLSAIEPDFKWSTKDEEEEQPKQQRKSTGNMITHHPKLTGGNKSRSASHHERVPDHHWESSPPTDPVTNKPTSRINDEQHKRPDHHWETPESSCPQGKTSTSNAGGNGKPEHHWESSPASTPQSKGSSPGDSKPEHHWELSSTTTSPKRKSSTSSNHHNNETSKPEHHWDSLKSKSASSHEPRRPDHHWEMPAETDSLKSKSSHERKPDHCWGHHHQHHQHHKSKSSGGVSSNHERRCRQPEHNWALPDPLQEEGESSPTTRLSADFNWKVDPLPGSSNESATSNPHNNKKSAHQCEKQLAKAPEMGHPELSCNGALGSIIQEEDVQPLQIFM